EQVRALDLAIRHKVTVPEALAAGQATVQEELDKVFFRDRYPVLEWRYPLGVIGVVGAGLLIAGLIGLRWGLGPGRLMRGEAAAGYLFASPWILGFLAFTAGPILASLIFSFCDYDVLHPARYVGFDNFRTLLRVQDVRFHWLEGAREAQSFWQRLETTR